MGLRATVKNTLGLQSASAEEALAASGQGPGGPSSGTTLDASGPGTTALSASMAGASPDAAKQASSPARQASIIRGAARSLSDAKNDAQLAKDAQAAIEQDPVRKAAMDRLAGIPGMQAMITQRVKDQALKVQTADVDSLQWDDKALLAAVGGDAEKAAALKANIKKLAANTAPDVATVNAVIQALNPEATLSTTLNTDELRKFVQDVDGGKFSKMLTSHMEDSAPAMQAMTDADAALLGYPSLDAMKADVEKITGKPFSELKVSDVTSSVKAYKQSQFADVAQLRLTLQDPTQAPQARAIAAEQMRRLGYSSVLDQERRAGDLTAQIQAGDTVKIGNTQVSVDKLATDPTLLADVQRILTDPEYRAELLKQDPVGNKAYVDWAMNNAKSLEPYLAKVQDDITAQQKVQDDLTRTYGPMINEPNISAGLKSLGVDLSKLRDSALDVGTLPPLAQVLFKASQAQSAPGQYAGDAAKAATRFANMSQLLGAIGTGKSALFKKPSDIPADLFEQLADQQNPTDALRMYEASVANSGIFAGIPLSKGKPGTSGYVDTVYSYGARAVGVLGTPDARRLNALFHDPALANQLTPIFKAAGLPMPANVTQLFTVLAGLGATLANPAITTAQRLATQATLEKYTNLIKPAYDDKNGDLAKGKVKADAATKSTNEKNASIWVVKQLSPPGRQAWVSEMDKYTKPGTADQRRKNSEAATHYAKQIEADIMAMYRAAPTKEARSVLQARWATISTQLQASLTKAAPTHYTPSGVTRDDVYQLPKSLV